MELINKKRLITINKLIKIIKSEEKSKEIEESIYDYSILRAKEKSIPLSLDNNLFTVIYMNKFMNIYLNLDENSYIKNIDLKKKNNK